VTTGERLETMWREKVDKYSTNECVAGMRQVFGERYKVVHCPVIPSYRRLLYARSATVLRKLGLTSLDLMDLCLTVVKGSLAEYDIYICGERKKEEYGGNKFALRYGSTIVAKGAPGKPHT
jgi:hypothetical protein